jgi:hypothetical protein
MKKFEDYKHDFGHHPGSNQAQYRYDVPLIMKGVKSSVNFDDDSFTVYFTG